MIKSNIANCKSRYIRETEQNLHDRVCEHSSVNIVTKSSQQSLTSKGTTELTCKIILIPCMTTQYKKSFYVSVNSNGFP